MDDESDDDNGDELRSEWGGESRDWRVARLTERIRELIPETGWCISEWAICDFQWRDGWWARKGDNRWRVGTVRGLNRDQIVKIARLTGCKNFVGKRKKFIFNAYCSGPRVVGGLDWISGILQLKSHIYYQPRRTPHPPPTPPHHGGRSSVCHELGPEQLLVTPGTFTVGIVNIVVQRVRVVCVL